MEVLEAEASSPHAGARDRLARAAAPRNFNLGLASVDWRQYTHVMKLDGDIELPPHYLRVLLERFAADPRLGLAGGVLVEPMPDGEARRLVIPRHHVHGALKCYSRECFEAIGGVQERLAWDTIDETYARMRGFATVSFEDLVSVHHRRWGSADGVDPWPRPARRVCVHHALSAKLGGAALGQARLQPSLRAVGPRVSVRLYPCGSTSNAYGSRTPPTDGSRAVSCAGG